MSWEKFKLLLDKNITLQKRHVVGGIFEIIFPICITIVLAYVRDSIKPRGEGEVHFHEFNVLPFDECEKGDNFTVAYSPGYNIELNEMMAKAIPEKIEIKVFTDSEKLGEFLQNETSETVYGIEFDDKLKVR